jgi:predicted metalloprotease
MGPFYCPNDQKVYLDLSFYRDLEQRFGAKGDSAEAYVIAHEVGHHVQNLVGTAQQVSDLQQRVDQVQANQLSVRLELQADCFAGVWARSGSLNFDESDVADALNAAAAIGDDRLQRATQGRVVPDAFTHGTSQQRGTWLKRGMETGDPAQCDTFKAASL